MQNKEVKLSYYKFMESNAVKNYKIDLALIDEIKDIVTYSTASAKRLSFFEKELANIQKSFNMINEAIFSAQDEYEAGQKNMALFEKSMKELGVDPKSNPLYVEASRVLDIQNKYAVKLEQIIKNIK